MTHDELIASGLHECASDCQQRGATMNDAAEAHLKTVLLASHPPRRIDGTRCGCDDHHAAFAYLDTMLDRTHHCPDCRPATKP